MNPQAVRTRLGVGMKTRRLARRDHGLAAENRRLSYTKSMSYVFATSF